jgi:hypothetical protein
LCVGSGTLPPLLLLQQISELLLMPPAESAPADTTHYVQQDQSVLSLATALQVQVRMTHMRMLLAIPASSLGQLISVVWRPVELHMSCFE